MASAASADVGQELSEARAKWNALGATSYSFVYSGAGDNIVPYPCVPLLNEEHRGARASEDFHASQRSRPLQHWW